MKGEISKSHEKLDKCLLMSINKRNDFLRGKLLVKAAVPFECSFPDCDKSYGTKSRITTHIRTHVNIT